MKALFLDTETSDKLNFKAPDDHPSQPWMLQVAAILVDMDTIEVNFTWKELAILYCNIKPFGLPCAEEALKVNHLSLEILEETGIDNNLVLAALIQLILKADFIVCHNTQFDLRILRIAFLRAGFTLMAQEIAKKPAYCTMLNTTNLCRLPGKWGKFKWPKLEELVNFLFKVPMVGAHNALVDTQYVVKCFKYLYENGAISTSLLGKSQSASSAGQSEPLNQPSVNQANTSAPNHNSSDEFPREHSDVSQSEAS